MEETYKGHTIIASAWQIRDTQRWQPKLVMICSEKDANPIKSPNINKYFSTREQAESEGLAIAKKWIEDGKPNLF